MHTTYAPARTATLRADADALDSEGANGPYTFSGIAVGVDDVLTMADGTPVLFTEDELRRAAASQANGNKLTVDHPEHDLGTSPPVEATIGDVTKAGFVNGQGVAYEAVTHDPEIARGIKAGTYDVSVHPAFSLGDQDPDTGAYIAEDVEFTDLSVVSQGASPQNTARWGPSKQLAAWANDRDVGAELDAADGVSFTQVTYDGTASGKLDESAIDSDDFASHYLLVGDTKSDSAYPVVDSEGRLREGNVEAAWNLRGHIPDSVSTDDFETYLETLAENFDMDLQASTDPPRTPEGFAGRVFAEFRSLVRGSSELEAASIEDLTAGTWVTWGTSQGKVRRTYAEGETVPAADYKGSGSQTGPAAVIAVYEETDDGYRLKSGDFGENGEERVAHQADTLTIDDPPADIEASQSADPGGRGSGRGADSDMNRTNVIDLLTDEHGFDEQFFEDMSDDRLETMHSTITDDGTDPGTGPGSGDPGQAGGTAGDVAAALDEQLGEHDSLDELVAAKVTQGIEASREAESKAALVEEIIANSEDFDADDREELMADSKKSLEVINKNVTQPSAAGLPAGSPTRGEIEASIGDADDSDAELYGTGVEGGGV